MVYCLEKLGLELRYGLRLGLFIFLQTSNSYPMIKYKGISCLYSIHLHTLKVLATCYNMQSKISGLI